MLLGFQQGLILAPELEHLRAGFPTDGSHISVAQARGRAHARFFVRRLQHPPLGRIPDDPDEADETFEVPPELEAELLESIAQADRGETMLSGTPAAGAARAFE